MTDSAQESRRNALSATGDARVSRTRRRLSDALHDEIAESGAGNLSVATITRRAGVARSTFYTHFATVEALALFAVEELFDELGSVDVARRAHSGLSREQITRTGLADVLDGLLANDYLLRLARDGSSGAAIRERFVDEMARNIVPIIAIERPDATAELLDYGSQFLAAGTLRVMMHWLSDERQTSRAELVELILGMLPAYLTGRGAD
ncbi:TetR/AcrR family transcriptional regulator [Nocardia sp. alder85J]|uniref:TetR/AcrR family transcriptional regulator n=1 Tax=Nocardia sp. alder85J TaxID=2862949 RepID=UPI001CD27E82|nr:TetR/AcrR family transcriptional regulator [Nocardia sp. alder85J]MCX4092371.1 TetR/AcrR family transcriptional regulator [Nocardia sp. alder85J]